MLNFLEGLILGLIITWLTEIIIKNKTLLKKSYDNPKLFFGYHVHHTVIGFLFIIFGIILAFINLYCGLFLIGFGIAMIIVHTLFDGRIVFIEKIKK